MGEGAPDWSPGFRLVTARAALFVEYYGDKRSTASLSSGAPTRNRFLSLTGLLIGFVRGLLTLW